MFLNIVTPCSRPNNLKKISESINIPKEHYKWIIVYDGETLPQKELIPEGCEIFTHSNKKSVVGHSQRNFALDMISEGYVYFNDDDTLLHKDLWENIKDLENDFITFGQEYKNGGTRLVGNLIKVRYIDSHNFIIDRKIIGETKFDITKYEADGYFAEECFKKSTNYKFINKILSTYNSLR
jgi:hypothetical protein